MNLFNTVFYSVRDMISFILANMIGPIYDTDKWQQSDRIALDQDRKDEISTISNQHKVAERDVCLCADSHQPYEM